MTRRAALQGAAAAGLIHRAPAIAALALQSVTKLTVTGYFRTLAFLVAAQRGLFTQEGLDVDFHLVRLALEHNKGLAGGRWLMTLSSIETMLARTTQDGVDFVAFMEAEEGLSVQLMARPGAKSLADLRGKLFAADPVDSNYDLIRNKMMRDNGIPEDQYRIEILGDSRVRAEALAGGKVDAAMLQPPVTDQAIASGAVPRRPALLRRLVRHGTEEPAHGYNQHDRSFVAA